MAPQQIGPNTTGPNTLSALLTSLQQGVQAINNLTQATNSLTQTVQLVFPST